MDSGIAVMNICFLVKLSNSESSQEAGKLEGTLSLTTLKTMLLCFRSGTEASVTHLHHQATCTEEKPEGTP